MSRIKTTIEVDSSSEIPLTQDNKDMLMSIANVFYDQHLKRFGLHNTLPERMTLVVTWENYVPDRKIEDAGLEGCKNIIESHLILE